MQKRISAQEETGTQTSSSREGKGRRSQGSRQYDAGRILDLQRTVGNRAVQRLLQAEAQPSSATPEEEDKKEEEAGSALSEVQPKLEVGSPDDPSEHEAESVAEHVTEFERSTGADVMRQALSSEGDHTRAAEVGDGLPGHTLRAGTLSTVGRLHVSAKGNSEGTVPASIEHRITQGRGTGQRLPAYVANSMALHTGYDFSNVRVKTGPEAAALNRSLNARAFTLGADIWLGANESVHDLRLMSHELTHVVQQGAATKVSRKESTGTAGSSVTQHLRALKNQGSRGASLYGEEIRRFQHEYPGDRMASLRRQILGGTPVPINQQYGAGVLRRWGTTTPTPATSLGFTSAAFNKGTDGAVTFSNSGGSASLRSPAYETTGTVEASGGTDADAQDWEAGYIQTLLSTSRAAHYIGSPKEKKRLIAFGPVRDALVKTGEPWYDPTNLNGPGRVPFTKTGEKADTKLWDRPGNPSPWDTPDGKGKLDHTDGKDKFATWMIARQKSAPNAIVYLNWLTWEVDWSMTSEYASKGTKTASAVPAAQKVTGSGAGKGAETPVLTGPTANDSAAANTTWS